MNSTIPVEHNEPLNASILAISEDLIAGFQRHPFHVIAEKSGVPLETVIERIRAVAGEYGLDVDPLRPVHTLSVGERQRVEIVRALLTSLGLGAASAALAFAVVVRHFAAATRKLVPGVHPRASVDPTAVLDPEKVRVGAGAVIMAGATVGDGSDIGPNTVIGEDVGDYAGTSVAFGGDTRGDGAEDLLVGGTDTSEDYRATAGRAWLVELQVQQEGKIQQAYFATIVDE